MTLFKTTKNWLFEFEITLRKYFFRIHFIRVGVAESRMDIFFFLNFGVSENLARFDRSKHIFFFFDMINIDVSDYPGGYKAPISFDRDL